MNVRPLRERAVGDSLTHPAVLGAAGLAVCAALGELIPRLLVRDAAILPPFSQVLGALATELVSAQFWQAVADTVLSWALGLTIAVVAGVSLGLVIGSLPWLRASTVTTIEFLRPIPSVAFVPLAVLEFGTHLRSALLLIVYAAFWQVLVQSMAGAHDVDPVARDTARSFRIGHLGTLRHIVWPTALPYVITGVRLAASVALILAITAELVIGSPGLGNEITIAQSGTGTATMYALILVTGLLGLLVNLSVRQVERRMLRWHASVRREGGQ